MALNFRKVGVDAGVFTCTLASMAKAPEGLIKEMLGKPVTLTKVGITRSDKGPYTLFTLAEYPDFSFSAGEAFNKLTDAWMHECDPAYQEYAPNECDRLNAELDEVGGLRVMFNKKKNKRDSSKSDYWSVNIL